jgi:hypothetical protein
VGRYAWDHGIDYKETRHKLRDLVESYRQSGQHINQYFSSILLAQLTNASRVSEAYDAVSGYARDGVRVQKVRVRKKRFRCLVCKHAKGSHVYSPEQKKRERCKFYGCNCTGYQPDTSDIELRDMVMPREITERDRPNLIDALAAGRSQVTVRVFAIKKAGFNSHSLRYSAISEMADKVPLQVIAKMTHHKSLDFIVDYTQQKKATSILKEIAEEA